MRIPVNYSIDAAREFDNLRNILAARWGRQYAKRLSKETNDEIVSLGEIRPLKRHWLGERMPEYNEDPNSPREVRKFITASGLIEVRYEIFPPFDKEPTSIAVLRIFDTRQDR